MVARATREQAPPTIPAIVELSETGASVHGTSAGERFAAAEGLRAGAALSILLFHTGVAAGIVGLQGGAGPYLQHLNVGVSVFFVLSAFLLYRPFVAARLSDSSPPRARTYAGRRALRILPAYWVALTVAVYGLHQASLGSGGQVLLYYGLAQIYSSSTALGGLVVAWSLCTEVSFYAYLPLHAAALRRLGGSFEAKVRAEYLVCAGLYAASIAFKVLVRADHQLTSTWLPSFLDTFALGMALAVATVAAERRGQHGRLASLVAASPGRVWLAAVLAYLVLANAGLPAGLDDPVSTLDYVGRQCTLGVVAILLVAPAVLAPNGGGWFGALLRSNPARWLGRISYGIFLWQLPIIGRLEADLRPAGGTSVPFWLLLPLVLICTLAAAQLSWSLVERPALRLRRWGWSSR